MVRSVENLPLVAVLMIDLDRFATVNQKHGHDAGDSVLREVGKALESVLRVEDVLGRYGGEEFCAVLRDSSVDDAQVVAERLRFLVASTLIEHKDTRLHITVSIGVAASATMPPHELVATAERALALAKSKGRNRVESL